jgi:hypothetical protein
MSILKDYDVERDKYGRIQTGNQGRQNENRGGGGGGAGGQRERSRERDQGGDRRGGGGGGGGEWNNIINTGGIANQGAGGNWKYGNTYGLSSPFLESLGIDGPLISRVFVSNVSKKSLNESSF